MAEVKIPHTEKGGRRSYYTTKHKNIPIERARELMYTNKKYEGCVIIYNEKECRQLEKEFEARGPDYEELIEKRRRRFSKTDFRTWPEKDYTI